MCACLVAWGDGSPHPCPRNGNDANKEGAPPTGLLDHLLQLLAVFGGGVAPRGGAWGGGPIDVLAVSLTGAGVRGGQPNAPSLGAEAAGPVILPFLCNDSNKSI